MGVSSGLSLLMSAYSSDEEEEEEEDDLIVKNEEQKKRPAQDIETNSEYKEGTDHEEDVMNKPQSELPSPELPADTDSPELTEDMFESYDGQTPSSNTTSKPSHHHSIYTSQPILGPSTENQEPSTENQEPGDTEEAVSLAGLAGVKDEPLEPSPDLAEASPDLAETSPDLAETSPDLAETSLDLVETSPDEPLEPSPDLAETSPDLAETSPDLAETSPDLAETSPDLAETSPDLAETSPDLAETSPDLADLSSQDEEELVSINQHLSFSRTTSLGSFASSLSVSHQEDSMSSLSQESEAAWGPRGGVPSTPLLIKEELIEYTDGAGQYFYVAPDESADSATADGPTYLPEQEFTSLLPHIQHSTIWNQDDYLFSSLLHNVGLIHKEAASSIAKLPSMQRSKLGVLLKSWSDQRSFTDCLVEMTDCDHFYDPIGYDTVLVTDPCMSAKYDFLSDGMNEQEVERKQLDEFYNFTEEKSFFFEKCKMCNKLFSNTFGLRQHIAHMHPNINMDELLKKEEGIFSCLKCKKSFNSQAQLKKHFQKTHIPKSSAELNIKCSHCGEYFKTRVLLQRHIAEKHRNRCKTEAAELHEPWSCELCKSVFYKKSNFLKHMQKTHGKLKVSERLLNSAKLSAQLSAQVGTLKQKEQVSPKPATRSSSRSENEPREPRRSSSRASRVLDLSEEERRGSSRRSTPVPAEQPAPSPQKVAPSPASPQLSPVKKGNSEVNVTCLFCKLCFVSYTDLQLHCTDVHRESNKILLLKMFTIIGSQPHGINFQCILCTKISPTPPIALGHLETVHLNDHPDKPKSEDTSSPENKPSYISPQLADFDGLSLMCRFCKKTFKNSKIKRKHEKSIHNDQSIVCFYCFIPILNRTELTKHIKTEHSGSKSLFKCRWCEAHFTSIPKRCSHMKEEHSSDVANIANRPESPTKAVTMTTPEKQVKTEAPALQCDRCNIAFPSSEQKSKHDKLIHNEVEINCIYCFSSFRNKESLIQHIAVYHLAYHKKPYKCKWCEITFETLYQRSLHMKHSHDVLSADSSPKSGEEGQVNTSANKSFPDDVTPTHHHRHHVTSSSSSSRTSTCLKEPAKLVRNCRFCDAEVTSMILKKHLIEHRQWDHFVCIFCDKTVPSIGGIKSHILRNHPFITTRKMDRSELGTEEIERITHIEKRHGPEAVSRRVNLVGLHEPPPPRISPEEEIVFPCQVCFFLFTVTHHVQEHWKVHSRAADQEWTCTLCDEQYGELRSFRFHVEMHQSDAYTFAQSTVDLQNTCGYCNITIETQQSLDGHVLIHRGADLFNCVFCKAKGATFREMKKHISQNHMNTEALPDDPSRHLNETPFNSSTFKCAICLKFCNNQFNLNSHTKAHILGGKPCSLCNFKFKDMSTLKSHLVLVHKAPEDFITTMENNSSRSDAVADYCELCDNTFSSQGRFQKHRKACRDRFRLKNTQDSALYSLLDNSSNSDTRSRQNSELHGGNEGVDEGAAEEEEDNEYNEDNEEDITQSSMDELENLPMEIPMKSNTDGSLCLPLASSPHSYNTRKRPRPESYANIVPAKMMNMSLSSNTTRQRFIAPKKEPTPESEPKPSPKPVMMVSPPALAPDTPSPSSGPETMYCEVCELNFSSHKQLYWHRHTKRHLAMELLSKGPTAVSHGKHMCDQCDQGYNCKKQLHWHKKITHEGRTNIAEIVLRQLPRSNNVKSDPRGTPDPLSSLASSENGGEEKGEDVPSEGTPSLEDSIPQTTEETENHPPALEAGPEPRPPSKSPGPNPETKSPGPNPGTKSPGPNPGPHICELCNLTFKSHKQLYNHKRTLSHIQLAKKYDPAYTETKYSCDECHIDFQSYKQLWNHKKSLQHKEVLEKMMSNGGAKPPAPAAPPSADPSSPEKDIPPEMKKNFVCLDCDCVFEDKKQMKWHKKTWSHKTITIVPPPSKQSPPEEPKPEPRPEPEPEPAPKEALKPAPTTEAPQHWPKHYYYCQECKLPFRALRSYTVHCKQHLKEGFKCTLCNQKFQFKNYNNVKRHLTNIHKIAGDRTKNYMETFHNFDQNAQPLKKVDPGDLMEGAVVTHTNGGMHSPGDQSEAGSESDSPSRSPGFIEGLLADVGLSLEYCERKPEWIEQAKCKFCRIDFENMPEMLLHINEDHDKKFHQEFLSQWAGSSSDGDDSDSDESEESGCGAPRDLSLSDVEKEEEEEAPAYDENGNPALPPIRIKRPGEPGCNGVPKKQKLGFGSRAAPRPVSEQEDLTLDTPDTGPSSKRQYACILCNTGFTVYLAWWYHSKTEHGFSNIGYYGGSAACKEPGDIYSSSAKKNVNAECPDCHAVFNQRLLLENHLKVHRKPKIFQCDFCCKKFNSCKNASRHRLQVHSIVVSGRKCYLCKSCDKHFARADELIEHVQQVHENASPTFCCATCGKVYNKESTFVSHIRECEPRQGDEGVDK